MIKTAALCYDAKMPHQVEMLHAIRSGLKINGVAIRNGTINVDCVITWRYPPPPQFHGVPHLILECGYINDNGDDYRQNRLRFISTAWNKRHGLSDWHWPQHVSDDRWNALDIELQLWKQHGSYVLLLEQNIHDAAAPDVSAFRSQVRAECEKRPWWRKIMVCN